MDPFELGHSFNRTGYRDLRTGWLARAPARLQRVHERHELDLRFPDGQTGRGTSFDPLLGRPESQHSEPMGMAESGVAYRGLSRHHAAGQPCHRAVVGDHPLESIRSHPDKVPVDQRAGDIHSHHLPLSGFHRHRGLPTGPRP